ncbi:MAG: hypothetical protein C0501_24600 [Isosphaera sp.]|nr:hypothetical protein [Isosphaera sp.]
MIRRLLIAAAASGVVSAAGCQRCCLLNDPGRRPNPFRPPAPGSNILLPPTNVPTTPVAPPPAPGNGGLLPPVGPGPGTSGFPPPSFDPTPAPKPPAGRAAPEILLPDDPPGGSSSRPAPTAEPPTASTAAGLPGFVRVKDGLASGRKPTLEGFDTLKRAGYRAVVQLHPAGADVSAAKGVAEGRGLRFVGVEATPENLADAVARFNAAVGDAANRPAYVFDDDGVRAGALWYLHFRTAEAMNDDAARVRARPLGLTDQGDEAKAFALATQRYLETR